MKISPHDLALTTRRLADLLGGGLTMSRSLSVLSAQSENPRVRDLLKSINTDLGSGQSLSDTLRSRNGTFGPVYVGLVRTGESSGTIDRSLEELATFLEADLETRQRIRAALAYPAVLLGLSVAVCFFLILFVIPKFELLFQDLGQQLPLPTRILIGLSAGLAKFWWLIGLAGAGAGFWIKKNRRLNLNRIPVLADLIRGASLQQWTQVMASLLKGGVPVSDALRHSRQTVNQLLFGRDIDNALRRVQEGASLSAALSNSNFFPSMLCELIGAGEESGRLDQTFERLALSTKREFETKTKLALSLMEPALILTMGFVVGFVAVAMLLPIFEMSANIR